MSYLRRVDKSRIVLLGSAALLIPACTSLLGTFEIGEVGSTSTSGTGTATSTSGSGGSGGAGSTGGSGGTGGDPTTSTGVGSAGSGTPLTKGAFVSEAGKFARVNAVSARNSIVAAGGTFTGKVQLNGLSASCAKAASCAFVGRSDFSQGGGADLPWLIALAGAGASDTAEILSTAVDSKGNAYVAGRYSGSLKIDNGSSLPTFNDGAQHAFFIEFDATAHPNWSLYNSLGGSSAITSIAVGMDDNPIIGANFTTAFTIGTCGTITVAQGTTSSVVTKFNATSSACQWMAPVYGADVKINAVASDFGGNALLTGSHATAMTFGAGFTLTKTASGADDLFAAKLDANQKGKPVWFRDIKSSKVASGVGIAPVQGPGNTFGVVVTGKLDGAAFAGTPCAVTSTTPGDSSVVARLDNVLGDCVWSKSFAGATSGLGVDGNSDVAVTGSFVGSTNFDGTSLLTSGPGKAAFVTKLKSAAGELLWSRGFIIQNPGESVTARAISGENSGEWFVVGDLTGTTDFGLPPPVTLTDGGYFVRLGN